MIFVIMKQNFETFSKLTFHFAFEENFGEDNHSMQFLSFSNFLRHPVDFYRTQVYLVYPGIPSGDRSMGPSVCPSVTESWFVDLADMSLVYEDANSILADDTNRAIPGNLEMQVTPPGDNFDQISESRPNFRISTKFQNLD